MVIERGLAMAEASHAAAGMLAADDPENPPELGELARFSLNIHPEFLARVEELSGKRVPLRTSVTLQGGRAGESFGSRCVSALPIAEVQSLVSGLRSGGREFLRLDEESLDPRDLCIALPLAAKSAGVAIFENFPALSVEVATGGRRSGVVVQTPSGEIGAGHFVNAAGAWAESPALGRLPAYHPQVTPRKGQMLAVRMRGNESLGVVVRTPDLYLVPRGDGRIVVGATVERAGFDKRVEPHAIAALLRAAAELWPPIARAEVVESWAGLRPGSADGLPLIGRTGTFRWVATGHFRNGILLAPGTARLLSQAIRGERPEIDLSRFDPERARPLDRPDPVASDNTPMPAL